MSYNGLEIIERLQAEIDELKARVKELENGKYLVGVDLGKGESQSPVIKTPQQIRDEIVERAKKDVSYFTRCTEVLGNKRGINYRYHSEEFIVNKEKRTVVALLKGIISGKIRAKGIAKCAPSDCFNVHIGKAIALRRALGLDVPSEYYNAPNPTEVRIGDTVQYKSKYRGLVKTKVAAMCPKNDDKYAKGKAFYHTAEEGYLNESQVTIIDDSRDE